MLVPFAIPLAPNVSHRVPRGLVPPVFASEYEPDQASTFCGKTPDNKTTKNVKASNPALDKVRREIRLDWRSGNVFLFTDEKSIHLVEDLVTGKLETKKKFLTE